MSQVPAGWYPDPRDAQRSRYWDGQRWTERTRRTESLGSQSRASAAQTVSHTSTTSGDDQRRYEAMMKMSPAERRAQRGCLPWWWPLIAAYIVVVVVAIATGD